MKIVLFGNFSVDYCSEVHHAKSIESLGHRVIRLQETEIATDQVLSESLQADALVWIHSHGFQLKGSIPMNKVLVALKHAGVPTLAYHLDLYMGLERWNDYVNSDYMNNLTHFFTVDKLMADWLNKNTNTKGHYLPAGVYGGECAYFEEEKIYDVIFVGSKNYHPEWSYRPQLINWLTETYGERFRHYGGDGLGVTRGLSLNRLYAQTKVVVGDTLCPGFDYPYYFSDRVFETVGRGGFIIHPYIKGLEDNFNLNGELVTYNYHAYHELKTKIDYYLKHDEEREAIRNAGYVRVLKDHTYQRRWEKIISILSK